MGDQMLYVALKVINDRLVRVELLDQRVDLASIRAIDVDTSESQEAEFTSMVIILCQVRP